ncbi:MAG: N-acetyltransferase [Desulfovibrio sp.]|nr:N-acetyltransferase [Desulfovibrio sp.]
MPAKDVFFKGIPMETNDVTIRLEKKEDYRTVENLVRESFWNVYRPGCTEHFVLMKLRDDPNFVPELDFVLEKEGRIIGQNVFVRTAIAADDGRMIPIMTMGPICIANDLKRQGYGKLLLDYSLEKAAEFGCKAVCFEGNIAFYGKSGFVLASGRGIRYHGLPEGMEADFFLCKELEAGYLNGITGEYATPQVYFVAEKYSDAFAAYDASFPAKEKLVLPGQLGQELANMHPEKDG